MSGNEGDLLQTSGSSLHAEIAKVRTPSFASSSRCASSAPECVPLSKLRRFHVAQGTSDSEEESKLRAALSGAAKRHASAGRGSSSSSPVSFRQSEPYTRCLVTASTPEPEGGARCVSSARRDLCGGRGEILVPTATIWPLPGSDSSARLEIILPAVLPVGEC